MSRVNDVHAGMWSEDDFLDLSAPAKLLYVWSFTNPLCGMSGVYRVARRLITFETDLDAEALDSALDELQSKRFVVYAEGAMFVRTRVKHLRTKSEQIAKSIANDVRRLPVMHPVRTAFLTEYGEDYEWGGDGRLLTCLHGVSMETPQEPRRGSMEAHRASMAVGRGKGSSRSTVDDGRARADDQWPDRLPDKLHLVAEFVHQRLGELANAKDVDPPARRRVGDVIADFPDHDHRAIVGDVVDYWRDGAGAKTVRKDFARVYRDRCARVVAAPEARVNGRHAADPETPLWLRKQREAAAASAPADPDAAA